VCKSSIILCICHSCQVLCIVGIYRVDKILCNKNPEDFAGLIIYYKTILTVFTISHYKFELSLSRKDVVANKASNQPFGSVPIFFDCSCNEPAGISFVCRQQ